MIVLNQYLVSANSILKSKRSLFSNSKTVLIFLIIMLLFTTLRKDIPVISDKSNLQWF